jgi:DNA-binding NtrC family response regulator
MTMATTSAERSRDGLAGEGSAKRARLRGGAKNSDARLHQRLAAWLETEFDHQRPRRGEVREALDKAKQIPFDLVLTDLRMPGMGGIALTEAIRALDSNAIVIWMTAYGCHKVSTDAARLSVYCCLDKPKVDQIRQIVREAFEAVGNKALVGK